jgi:hypothetical protein
VVAGRVDARRDRAAVLAHAAGKDVVIPVDLATGKAGTALPADPDGVAAGAFSLMDIDSSTGQVYLAARNSGVICFKSTTEARLDLDTGTVTASAPMPGCSTSVASDQNGKLYTLETRSVSANLPPSTTLVPLDEQTMQPDPSLAVRQGTGLTLAVDGVHHLALVAFSVPAGEPHFGSQTGVIRDNNATSQVAVIDLTTGKTVRTLNGFLFTDGFGGLFNGGQERSVQLDPTTRTGWTYGHGMEQIQQFSY